MSSPPNDAENFFPSCWFDPAPEEVNDRVVGPAQPAMSSPSNDAENVAPSWMLNPTPEEVDLWTKLSNTEPNDPHGTMGSWILNATVEELGRNVSNTRAVDPSILHSTLEVEFDTWTSSYIPPNAQTAKEANHWKFVRARVIRIVKDYPGRSLGCAGELVHLLEECICGIDENEPVSVEFRKDIFDVGQIALKMLCAKTQVYFGQAAPSMADFRNRDTIDPGAMDDSTVSADRIRRRDELKAALQQASAESGVLGSCFVQSHF